LKAIFITVRTSSTRLPNKATLDLCGKPTIQHVIDRAKRSKLADIIVLCTTENQEDDYLCKIAKKNKIECFRGSEEDKLERWHGAAKKYGIEFFVTADGDDLFCSEELMDLAFEQRRRNNSNFIEAGEIICGSFTYGISTSALRKVCKIKDSKDTEMMWVYFTNTGLFNVEILENVPSCYVRSDIRMTLDYKDDFVFFKTVIDYFRDREYSIRDVIDYIDKNPQIKEINFYLQEAWSQNQKNKTNMRIK
tara:strand:+ start:1197 stop:1943 length:747 start_codon:yes stop_codon:yes gene_type:complete